MSDSDILSIQLWFGAVAIAVAAIAMTAAGWNHRYFIRATFALAAALAGVALFWRTISARIPDDASERVLSVTSSPISWFIAFVAATAAMFLISRSKNTNQNIDRGGIREDTPAPAKVAFCSFGPMRWERAGLDPGEDRGGKQLFFRLYIPVVFNRNAPSTTARISVLRGIDRGAQKLGLIPARPLYVWRPFEQKNFLTGDVENIVIATIAENRQHHGYYGDLRPEAGYISSGSKHLFEIKILSDSEEEKHEIYIEYSQDQIYASGSFPGDLGEFGGQFIVIQEGTDVFKAKWVDESRAAADAAF